MVYNAYMDFETKEEQFSNWTEYDDWLIQNYEGISVVELNEMEDKKIKVVYAKKEDYEKWVKSQPEKD